MRRDPDYIGPMIQEDEKHDHEMTHVEGDTNGRSGEDETGVDGGWQVAKSKNRKKHRKRMETERARWDILSTFLTDGW